MTQILAADIKKAYRDVLIELTPNVMVTHNFWGTYEAPTAQDRMKVFYSAMQRQIFGTNWAKQTHRPWPTAYGFREHPNSNPHYHVLIRACPRLTEGLIESGSDLWCSLACHGQLDVQVFEPGKMRPIIYCTKGLTNMQAVNDVFLYSDTRGITKRTPPP